MLGLKRTFDRVAGAFAPRKHAIFCSSHKEHGVLGLGLLLGDHGAADGHDQGDDAVDALGGLVLGGLEVAGGVLGEDVAVVVVAPMRRTSCPPRARVSVRQPGVTVGAATGRRLSAVACRRRGQPRTS